jgi:flagellar basal-body rod protein FlgB
MSLLDQVEMLRGHLDYHLSRHNVLVSNLAQADTPEYTPVDLARGKEFDGKLRVAMDQTQPGHMVGEKSAAASRVVSDPTAAGSDGNGVDMDKEAVKIATNQMRYDVLAQLASSELAGLEWAATDGKGG